MVADVSAQASASSSAARSSSWTAGAVAAMGGKQYDRKKSGAKGKFGGWFHDGNETQNKLASSLPGRRGPACA